MQILSFDTSGSDVQIALMQYGVIAYEKTLAPAKKNRQESASTLLPGIDFALKQMGWLKRDLDLIVTGVGPGSFTGVRVSVITARSIAQALGLGIVPISSLEVLASVSPRPCAVVLGAGSSKYFAAAYAADELCSEILQPACVTADELRARLQDLPDLQNILLAPELDEIDFAKDKNSVPYPESLNFASEAAVLAGKRLSATGEELNRDSLCKAYPWDNVLPLYLRSPSVTLKANGSSDKKTIGS